MSLVSSKKVIKALLKKLQPGFERGGVVTPELKLIEFENVSTDPEAFQPKITPDSVGALNTAIATWHTHPSAQSNLSVGDAETFKAWPDLHHAIVGEDGVSWYFVKNGAILRAA